MREVMLENKGLTVTAWIIVLVFTGMLTGAVAGMMGYL
jgi:hypothetical protein